MAKLEVINLTDEQLQEELATAENTYSTMLYNNHVATLENTGELVIARKNIARLKTEIRRRELEKVGGENRDRIRARRRRDKKIKKN